MTVSGAGRDVARRRVVESHRLARRAFRLGAVFVVAAVAWSGWVLAGGGPWWGPIHAFAAGGVLLAISGATQLFTITWSAAPAPRPAVAAVQRWALAAGVGLVLAGRVTESRWSLVAGAMSVLAGLVTLGWILVGTIRRSLLRRFDLSSRFYLVALAAGVVGVGLGGFMGSGAAGDRLAGIRLVHYHLNLVGLVGFVIVGTLPTILPTFAHHRMVSGREAKVAWWLAVGSVVSMMAGLVFGAVAVGLGSVLAGAALLLVLGGVVGRLGRRGLRGGLAYLQVVAGCGWLAAWVFVDGWRLVSGRGPDRTWVGAALVAGVGQVLFGALAYLLPVLAGRPPRLGRNLDRTHRRPWLPLVSANLAGVGFFVSATVATVAAGVWVADFAYRIGRMQWRDAD